MKFFLINLLVIISIPTLSSAQRPDHFKQVRSQLREKNYFAARDYHQKHSAKLSKMENLVLKASIAAAFNQPEISNRAIALFRKQYETGADDSLKLEMLRLQQNNYSRLFDYASALEANNEISSKYRHLLSENDISDGSNTAVIWKVLAGKPKQRIELSGSTVIKMKRDAANLANIGTEAEGKSIDFIFDTGANFSTVSRTTANIFHMQILEGEIEVGTITGAKVPSKVAICPKFSIGNIKVENAVFLVLPDSALAFPQIKYQINGIIGFPVIEGLKEVQLTRADEFIVPKIKTRSPVQNMALDFLTPVYQLEEEYFTFDTGANGSMLYSKYLQKHRPQITAQYPLIDLKFGGAGGVTSRKGYKITYRPVVAGKKLELSNVEVFSEKFDEDRDHFYGNLGQDVIKQFEKMTINFTDMFIQLK